jgi:hypothetical protein
MKKVIGSVILVSLLLAGCDLTKVGNEYYIIPGAAVAKSYNKAVEIKNARGVKSVYQDAINSPDVSMANDFGIRAKVQEKYRGICKIWIPKTDNVNEFIGYTACDNLQ